MAPAEQTQLAVRIPTDLHRRLKVYSARKAIPMAELVAEAIRDLLKRKE